MADTGVLADHRYFDVEAEYAKASPDDVLIRVTVHNRGPDAAPLSVLPTLWFRNTWSWGRMGERFGTKPALTRRGERTILATHEALDVLRLELDDASTGVAPVLLFTENETNTQRMYGTPNARRHLTQGSTHS